LEGLLVFLIQGDLDEEYDRNFVHHHRKILKEIRHNNNKQQQQQQHTNI
jgi:hypothetical protein